MARGLKKSRNPISPFVLPSSLHFKCGLLGHRAATCRDPVVCFRCGKVNHRAWQCRADLSRQKGQSKIAPNPAPIRQSQPIKAGSGQFRSHSTPSLQKPDLVPPKPDLVPPKPDLVPSKPDSKPDLSSGSPMAFIKRFNSSPASLALEAALKRSVFLANTEGWGRERFLEALRQIAPFPWKVSTYPDGYMLVEGPGWWRQQVLSAGMAMVEGKEILAEPWNQEIENGFRLKSIWIKILGLPLKLWHRAEFERLIEGFGILLEIDQATEEKTSFVEAKIRIGVPDYSDIPPTGKAIFRTDKGDWGWKPVQFVFDIPGGGRLGGIKRRRIWTRRTNPAGDDQADGEGANGGNGNDDMEEDNNGEGFEDEDLLHDNDRRNVRHHETKKGTKGDEKMKKQDTETVIVENELLDDIPSGSKSSGSMKDTTSQNVIVQSSEKGKAREESELTKDRQMVIYQEKEVPQQHRMQKEVTGGTRQSLRQKLLNPEQPVQEKASQRMKEKNLEIAPKDLFGVAGDKIAALQEDFWSDDQKVTVLENDCLTKPFSFEEIKSALFDSAAEKSPGPDDEKMMQVIKWIFIGFEAISEVKHLVKYWSGGKETLKEEVWSMCPKDDIMTIGMMEEETNAAIGAILIN